jgi:hypothetical protein
MKKHRHIKGLIDKLIAGEISQNELELLQKQVKDFPEYEELVHTHKFLTATGQPIKSPKEERFTTMRTTVLRKIRIEGTESSSGRFSEIFENIRIFLLKPEMAVAALTLIVGFLLGRALPPDANGGSLNILKQISFIASENKQLSDIQKSPLRYSNATIKDIAQDKVSLSFDVTTHIENDIRSKNDPVVAEILTQTLLNPSHTGSELKAISYTESIFDRKLKEAVILTMHNAPLHAVRMKALFSLLKYKNDQDIQEALKKVLKEEDSVQMRLKALDYLEETKINPDILWSLLEESKAKVNPAVMRRVLKYVDKQ